jgi:hypothetical protein
MVMKCLRCNGSLEITGFDGSAIHTRCTTCNIVARPKSHNPHASFISKIKSCF